MQIRLRVVAVASLWKEGESADYLTVWACER